MRAILILVILITTSCSNYRKLEPDGDRSSTDYLLSTTDNAAKAANIPILRDLPLDDDLTEIRIWVGFGPLVLQSFYRIRVLGNQQVDGGSFWYFDTLPEQWEQNERENFYKETYEYCNKIGVYEGTESCLIKFDEKIDWNHVYNNLSKLDIWNIPDNSEIPKYMHKDAIVILDGSHIVVELKKKGYYRSYGHRLSPEPIKKKYQYGTKIMDSIY